MSPAIKNIAIVGATGRAGGLILSSLLRRNQFNITAVTRSDSTGTIPPHSSVKVAKGSYNDASFLSNAFKGQDVLILALGFQTSSETQNDLIDAAGRAGVKWIIPNEFGSDNDNVPQRKDVPFSDIKTQFRERIEAAGSKWIGIVTNPWFDYGLQGGFFGIDLRARKATVYGGGDVKHVTTNLSRVGEGVAALLSLPESSSEGRSLESYANKFVYLASHVSSQNEMLRAVQRATKTSDADWEIERVDDVRAWREEGREKFNRGDYRGGIALLYGQLYLEGSGSNYQQKLDLDVLGLKLEDLDESVKKALESEPPKYN